MKTKERRISLIRNEGLRQDAILSYYAREMLYNCAIMKLGTPRYYYYVRP
jgi:hypothetical protein